MLSKASSRHDFHVIHWLRLSLQIIQHCYNPTEESTRKLHGNQKVLKASLEFIASFAEIQRSKGKKNLSSFLGLKGTGNKRRSYEQLMIVNRVDKFYLRQAAMKKLYRLLILNNPFAKENKRCLHWKKQSSMYPLKSEIKKKNSNKFSPCLCFRYFGRRRIL